MDKKIKLWKNIQKWICYSWILWGLALAWDTYGSSFVWEGLIFSFVLIWPILFLVLLILTYYEIEKLRSINDETDVKMNKLKYLSILIKKIVIALNIFWLVRIFVPDIVPGYTLWLQYLKILALIGSLYYLVDWSNIKKFFRRLSIKIED